LASAQVVTAGDVTPHGWVADACGCELQPGDLAIALTAGGE